MRYYSNSIIIELPVRNCAECPNKLALRHKTPKGFGAGYVCGAISRPFTARDGSIKTTYNPSLSDVLKEGGFLPDCPLPDFTGGRK